MTVKLREAEAQEKDRIGAKEFSELEITGNSRIIISFENTT